MSIKTNSVTNLPFSALVAIIVTGLLFIAIPLLTKISTMQKKRERVHHVMISQRKPPPPPEPEKEKRLEEQKKQEAPKKAQQRQRMPQPKLNVPTSGLTAGMGGTIAIGGLLNQDFEVSDSLFVTAFKLNEVDQPPRPIRVVPPRYPFEAQQKGIEGKITLRFVVDVNGQAQEPEVVKVDPPEIGDIFNESALEVVKRYKFRPAMKSGKAVDCIVNLPIKFTVSE